MSTNISGEKRQALLSKIAEIKSFIEQNSNDKNASQLISYLGDLTREVNGKKYGLVFEEHREAIDEKLEQNAPVLIEEKDLFIDNGGELNFLLEGDNLASLKLLEKTHRGKIDVIYIDPPYNTGNKDFVYDDDYVDSVDQFRHSKWLSFMEKRLKIAKNLLSEKAFIFISIDDNEQIDLRILCNEIFGEENFVANLPTIMNLKGNQDEYGFAGTHEYTIVYAKNKNLGNLGHFKLNEDEIEDWEEDEKGYFKQGATLKRTGEDSPREHRPYGYFPILINKKNNSVATITKDEYLKIYNKTNKSFDDDYIMRLQKAYESEGFAFILPNVDNLKASWRWGFDTVEKDKDEIIVNVSKDGYSLYKKQRPEFGNIPTQKPKTLFYKPEYSSGNGTSQLKEIFNAKVFNNPKPIDLIKDFLQVSTFYSQSATILDFFAGSGTTGHAVLKLNAEDGGHRKFILCTNNENNICREITYQRLKTVITGSRMDGSKYSDGLPGSLKYFKTDFIPISEKMYYEYADDLLLHVRELVELENAVNFDKDKTVAIVLDDDEMEEFIATLVESGRNEQKDTSTGLSVRSTGLSVRALYVGHDVLVSGKQERILKSHNISINTIPDYYYRDLAL